MLRLYGLILLVFAYVAWRLLPELHHAYAGAALALVLAVMAVSMTFAVFMRRAERRLPDALAWVAFLSMGALSSLFILTLARDAGLLAVSALDLLAPLGALPARLTMWSAGAVPLLAAVFSLVGFVNARRRAEVRVRDIPIADLPAGLQGFRIAQVSDVHVGPTIKRAYLDAIVEAVNALEADLVAVTGDLVDGSVHRLAAHVAPLARLRSRHGSFFVTGNHEYYSGADAWVAELRRLGLRVLMNEHALLEHEGEALLVAGVTDYSAHHFEPAQKSDPGQAISGAPVAGARILLAHQPRSAFAAAAAGFDLQLSGHTHGGQFLPWNLFVRLQQPFVAGLHRVGKLLVYVSRGAGYWGPPLRLGAPSEITLLRLVRA